MPASEIPNLPLMPDTATASRVLSPPAVVLPELGPEGAIEIAAVPSPPDIERGWLTTLLPGLSALGMLGFALLSPNIIIVAIMGGVAIVTTFGVVWTSRHSRRRREQQWEQRSERYRRHLAQCDKTLTESGHRQRAHAELAHPAPDLAVIAALHGRMWEAAAGETGLALRLGTGRAPARRPPRFSSQSANNDGDPELERRALAVIGRHSAVDEIPVWLDITPGAAIFLTGDRLALLRALVVSLARAYPPKLLRLHVLAAPAEAAWLQLLPHTSTVVTEPDELRRALRAHPLEEGPHHLVIAALGSEIDFAVLSPTLGDAKASVLALLPPAQSPPAHATITIDATADHGVSARRATRGSERQSITRPDALSFAQAHAFALAASRYSPGIPKRADGSVLRLQSLLDPPAHPLMIPIGRDDDGERVLIDLREAASGGHGPHGLVIGCTGSGKSELLRTLLVAAAHQSPPEELALLLIDYKGGAAFAELARLPHVAGVLTNLSSDPHAIVRTCASLRAELRRRQQVLRGAGVGDIESYRAYAAGMPSPPPPMPRLLVVVDEYAELIEESPEALDVLTALGRLGRSLGIHLLLSSQRLDDGRLRGLDAHLRLRVCLRTLSPSDSIAVIGSPIAAKLPSAPGGAWVSRDGALTRVTVALADEPTGKQARAAHRAAPICLPPLPEAVTLGALLSDSDAIGAPVGLTDLPELGAQRPLLLDLSSGAAHVAIAGAPRSGRSTALATVVTALATTTSPRELAIHVITSAGSPLAGVHGLPHVGTVATSPELARRVVLALEDCLTARQQSGAPPNSRIVLVIDDVNAALPVDDAVTAALSRIANVGLSAGISLAVSVGRWLELRGGLREAIGTRWELRLNDPADSQLPAIARRVTVRPAGHVLTAAGTWAQLALPRLDQKSADPSPYENAAGLSKLVATVARRGGPATRPIQLLPDLVAAQSLPAPRSPGQAIVGVGGPYADPVELPLGPGEHLLLLGNSRTGRSGLLRALVTDALSTGSRVWLIDPRQSLSGVSGLGGRCHRRATSPEEIAALVAELIDACCTGEGQPHSSTRPAHFLVIDDLDLAEGRDGGSTLSGLAELLPYAAELPLTIVAARRAGGSARAAFNAFYGRFLEFCDTGLIFSGDPAEGPVFAGQRPRRRPPGRADLVIRGEMSCEVQTAWLCTTPFGATKDISATSHGHAHPRGWV
jgi:S-DNA-T family DNA segregation ATPase FtsK/SpoIIIE